MRALPIPSYWISNIKFSYLEFYGIQFSPKKCQNFVKCQKFNSKSNLNRFKMTSTWQILKTFDAILLQNSNRAMFHWKIREEFWKILTPYPIKYTFYCLLINKFFRKSLFSKLSPPSALKMLSFMGRNWPCRLSTPPPISMIEI